MNGAIIKNEPLLSLVLFTLTLLLGELVHLFSDSGEELPDEVEVFILSISAFNDSPVSESVFSYDGDEGETFPFVDGAVDCDFFIGSCPSLVSGHVQVEPALVQEIYFCLLFYELPILRTVFKPVFQGFRSISLLRHAFDSLLFEFAYLEQSSYCGSSDILHLALLLELQILDFVEFNSQLVLSHKRILLDQPPYVFEPFNRDLPLRTSLSHVFSVYSFRKGRVFLPFRVQLVDGALANVKEKSNLSEVQLRSFKLEIVLRCMQIIKFSTQHLQSLIGEFSSIPFLRAAFLLFPINMKIQFLIFFLLLFFLHLF